MKFTLRRWRLVAAFLAVVAALVVALFVGRSGSDRAAEKRAAKTYEETIKPLAYEGGMIVQQEIKPRLADLESGKVTPDQFRLEATRWSRDFKRIRLGFREAPRPKSLEPAAVLYDEAMSGYVRAIQLFLDASHLKGEALKKAITDAIPVAELADKTYDRAKKALDKELRRLGLPAAI